MSIVDADYCFISIYVGAYGKSSDSNVFKGSDRGKKVYGRQLNVSQPRQHPGDGSGVLMPHVIVADEAFALCDISQQKPGS